MAAGALALLLTLPAAPASADCGSTVEQGSYDPDSNTFTPGTAATDDDIRVTCTESGTDGDDVITLASVDTAVLPPNFGTGSYVVINLNGSAPFSIDDAVDVFWVVTSSGIETTDSGWPGDGIAFYNSNQGTDSAVWLEVRGPITTRGDGARGVQTWITEGASATVVNRGTINTHGGVDTSGSFDRTAHGVQAASQSGTATVRNYGHVETRGNAADGILAYTETDGTAIAINHGTVIVRGGAHLNVNPIGTDTSSVGRPTPPTAVQSYSELGDARAANMAGGTVEAHGDGSTAVEASVGGHLLSGGTGDALAENSGSVTTSGDVYELVDPNNANHGALRSPAGVQAATQGSGEARAVNHEGGTIETTGTNGIGLFAWSGDSGATGDTVAINRGTIVTRGDMAVAQVGGWNLPAHGIQAESAAGDATIENDGNVNTYGTGAYGALAISDTGNATAVNRGNITTHHVASDPANAFAERAIGLVAYTPNGNAEATNEASGSITTLGEWSFGMVAETANDGSISGATVEGVNAGTIATEGDGADGILVIAFNGGTASNPNALIARNEATGTITTMGDAADGMVAGIGVGTSGIAYGSVRAENHGTITTSGDSQAGDRGNVDAGVSAVFFPANFSDPNPTVVTQAGDATAVNTGIVTVSGASGIGIRAVTNGSGTATVNMTGGSVTASAVDDPATADIDESGIGISAWTGATGTASVTVSGSATVTAPTAARLIGGTTSLVVDNGQLTGDVVFGEGTSTLETKGLGLIDGDVTFGAGGDDTLILNVLADLGISGITGDVTGVEDMIKRGPGIARVNNVTFAGSSLVIEEGGLNVRGHVDLGADGTVTVEDAGRLTMEVGDVGTNASDHGQITAGGGVTIEGNDPAVFAAYDPDLTDAQRAAAQAHLQTQGFTPFSGTTTVTPGAALRTEDESGQVADVGMLEADGTATLSAGADLASADETGTAPTPTPDEPAAAGGGGGSGGGGAVVGGALVLAFLLFDLAGDDEEASAGSFAPVPSTLGWAESEAGGAHYWVHALTDRMPATAGTVGSVQGVNMGLTAPLGGGFHLGLSATPQVQAALGDDTVEGRRYALQGGWSTDDLFANVSLSRGEYTARTAFANLDGLGTLGGTFGLRHEQAQAEVGTSFGIGGFSLDPALSLVAGSLDRDAYTAESAALRSAVPAFSQRYEGWKARVSLAPTEWLGEGSVRWRPELNLATAQTSTDGPGTLSLRQSDRAGVLSFSTPAREEALPRTVHALGTSVSIAKAETWKLRGGYLAMMADGELVHAAVARFKLRF